MLFTSPYTSSAQEGKFLPNRGNPGSVPALRDGSTMPYFSSQSIA
jgi:hypothetical protein